MKRPSISRPALFVSALFATVVSVGLYTGPGRTAVGVSSSNSIASFPARVFASDSGESGLKVLPMVSPHSVTSEGVLFDVNGRDGADHVHWIRQFVNLPSHVFICNYQTLNYPKVAIATVGTFGFIYTTHWLVIYGPSGEVMKDYALEELLTPTELKRFQPLLSTGPTGRYIWWSHASFQVQMNRRTVNDQTVDSPALHIDLPGDVHLLIDLVTGQRINVK